MRGSRCTCSAAGRGRCRLGGRAEGWPDEQAAAQSSTGVWSTLKSGFIDAACLLSHGVRPMPLKGDLGATLHAGMSLDPLGPGKPSRHVILSSAKARRAPIELGAPTRARDAIAADGHARWTL